MKQKTITFFLLILIVLFGTGCSHTTGPEINKPIDSYTALDSAARMQRAVDEALHTCGYAAGFLSENERVVYMQICAEGAQKTLEEIRLEVPVTFEDFERIWKSVLNDKPQLEWARCEYPSTGGMVNSFTLRPRDGLDMEQVSARQRAVDEQAERLLDGLWDLDGAQAAVLLHDRLLEAITYEQGPAKGDAGNLYGALARGKGVCDAYSRAYQYLLSLLKIPCVYVRGTSVRGIPHSWNKLYLEGEWYCADLTWDDTTPDREYVFHDYLLVPDAILQSTHFPEQGQYLALPRAEGMALDYYRMHGYYIETGAPKEEIREKMARAFSSCLDRAPASPGGRVFLEIKLFGDQEKNAQAFSFFRENVFAILKDIAALQQQENGRPKIETKGKILYDYNELTQVLTMRPLLSGQGDGV